MQVILASQSPRRKKLLEQTGLPFKVHPSTVSENIGTHKPADLVEELALLKARDVSRFYTDALIIGSDTIVVHNDAVLGKPEDEPDAIIMLRKLSQSDHLVFTGVAFVKVDNSGEIVEEISFHEQTKVTFSPLDESDIVAYVKSGSPMDKAGGYGIQDDIGALFVEKINGDYNTVVGFPLNRFYRELKKFAPGINLYG